MKKFLLTAIAIIFLCCSLNVHSLNLRMKNPLGLKGNTLRNFVNNLHLGLQDFQNIHYAKLAFSFGTNGKDRMDKASLKNFLNGSSKNMGGGDVPDFIIDRFWNESVRHVEDSITFEQFQKELVFCLNRDIYDFTGDILLEDPDYEWNPSKK